MKMTGGQYLARALDGYGVTHVFYVPTMISWTLVELEKMSSIKRILVHDERAAGFMADGYARATGHPQVIACQMVGSSNLAAGVRDAYLASSPVIAMSGGPTVASRHRHKYQQIENLPLFEQITKFNAHVEDVTRLPDLLAQAFRCATSGKPGPVHLELEGHLGEVTETQEADLELVVEEQFSSTPAFRPYPDPESVRRAADLLAHSERPIFMVGGGARTSGAGPEMLKLAEKLSIPVATSLNAKEMIAGDHPLSVGVAGLYQRDSANLAILEADLVCFVGSKTDSQATRNWEIPRPGTRVIQIDIDPEELGKHYPNEVSLLGDAKVTLGLLVDAAVDGADRTSWVERAQTLVRNWRNEAHAQLESNQVPIRPERLMKELTAWLPSDSILVADTGHAGFWTGSFLDFTNPGQSYLRSAGTLGWGLPAAIGAKMGAEDRPVILFTGDGGLWYHLSEIETAIRWGVKVVVVLNDNRSLNEETPFYKPMYGGTLSGRHEELWKFTDVDFAAVARSLGANGLRVTKPADFVPALEKALDSDRLTVVDTVTDIDALCPWGTTYN